MRSGTARGFTLIELLVALAIIALLVGVLLPAYAGSRRKGWEATCTSNLRQLAIAWRAYCDDWDGPPATLATIREPYVRTAAIFRCPADPDPNGMAKSGSVDALVNDGIDPNTIFPIGVTYAYDSAWGAGAHWQRTITKALEMVPSTGLIGCPCHGEHVAVPRGDQGPTSFTGLVLRARPDGSVIRARQSNSSPWGQDPYLVLYGRLGGAGEIVFPPAKECIEYRRQHCPEGLEL